jgi:hypothetical protein
VGGWPGAGGCGGAGCGGGGGRVPRLGRQAIPPSGPGWQTPVTFVSLSVKLQAAPSFLPLQAATASDGGLLRPLVSSAPAAPPNSRPIATARPTTSFARMKSPGLKCVLPAGRGIGRQRSPLGRVDHSHGPLRRGDVAGPGVAGWNRPHGLTPRGPGPG